MSDLPFNWSKLQSADEMDVGRHFEYDSYAAEMFKKWLPPVPQSGRILEVGSGSGFFTGKLRFLYPHRSIICLEPDPILRSALLSKFHDLEVLTEPLETCEIPPETFDLAISHVVIHNLPDPLQGLKRMERAVKSGGFIVCIEPTSGYRHILPHENLTKAFDVLKEYSRVVSIERTKVLKLGESRNPYSYSYPELFEELGLVDITCYGWCSVFTLSDPRFEFEHKKKWVTRRKKLLMDERDEKTRVMVEAGLNKDRIDDAYDTILAYLGQIESASEDEISHIHEQEISNRTITIGRKK